MAYFSPYIDGSGIHMPTYEDRLDELVSSYRSIFGIESELSESVPDYQLLSIFAKALDDTSMMVLQAYMSRNPLYATGAALDALLPTYGIVREAGEDDATVRAKIAGTMTSRGAGSLDAIQAAVSLCLWVRSCKVYENCTDSTDANGIPAHSIAAVIYGGNAPAVAQAIYDHKAPGIGTYGSSYEDVVDGNGNTHRINYSRTTSRRIFAYMIIRRLPGIDEAAVTAAITEAVNALPPCNTR